jgi:osmotically-inducible protein OsmY
MFEPKLLDASQQTRQVYAMTRDGVVTLSGTVETDDAKQLAVRLARETQGVTDVVDLIDVEGPAATTGTLHR